MQAVLTQQQATRVKQTVVLPKSLEPLSHHDQNACAYAISYMHVLAIGSSTHTWQLCLFQPSQYTHLLCFKQPSAATIILNLIPPSQPYHQTTSDVLHDPEIHCQQQNNHNEDLHVFIAIHKLGYNVHSKSSYTKQQVKQESIRMPEKLKMEVERFKQLEGEKQCVYSNYCPPRL